MTSTWASVAMAACLAAPLPAQSTAVREAGLATVVTFAEPAVYTAGLTASLRPSLRTRVALYAGGGVSDGEGVGAGGAGGPLSPQPAEPRTPGCTAAGGLAGVFGSGFADGYIVLLVGVEGAPGGRGGWFVEAGIGGGARLAAGYRWRKLPPGWRAKG